MRGIKRIINNVLLKKNVIRFVLWIFLYRLLLDAIFNIYISPLWDTTGYGLYSAVEFDYLMYFLSWSFLMISMVWSYSWYSNNSTGSSVLIFIYCISFVPFSSMMGYSVFPLLFSFLNLLYWSFLGLFYYFLESKRHRSLHIKTRSQKPFSFIIVILAIFTMISLGYYSGFRIDLNILNAYDYRDEARNYTYPAYMTYLLGLSRIIIPTGIVLFLKSKKILPLIIVFFSLMINYSFDGGKTLFFISFVAILVGLFFKEKHANLVVPAFPIVLIIGFIDYFYFTQYLFILIIRRLLYVPNLISSYVYDYTLNNSPNYFSQLLRFIGIESYNIDLNYYIGAVYFDSPLMSANDGMLSDALWQLGFTGVLIMPFIISIILYFLNRTTMNISKVFLFIPSFIIAYYLNNSSLTAALFSHGIVVFILLMALFHRNPTSKYIDN